jgi:arsenate reductase
MAEGFARTYGSDVLHAQSAGLAPALAVAPLTHHVMMMKSVALGNCYPKQLEHVQGPIDLVINMSGYDLPADTGAAIEIWDIPDPIGESEIVFCQVRDDIERRVLQLIDRLRSRKPVASEAVHVPAQPSKVDTRRRPTRQ